MVFAIKEGKHSKMLDLFAAIFRDKKNCINFVPSSNCPILPKILIQMVARQGGWTVYHINCKQIYHGNDRNITEALIVWSIQFGLYKTDHIVTIMS